MEVATRAAQRDAAANLLTATPTEAALVIACALTDPRDLLALALACRRFFTRSIAAPPLPRSAAGAAASGGTAAAAAQQVEMWSIIEEAARQWIARCTDQERGWVPRRGRESWLGLMREVQALHRGAVFGRSHGLITLSEGGAQGTRSGHDGGHRTAASKAVMRAGRHYAQFTMVSGDWMFFGDDVTGTSTALFGVIRPGWDVEGGQNAHRVDGHCFHDTYSGRCYPGIHDWEGRQRAREEGDRIGMLLDLDQGSMTIYKNDERLGVTATGLSGEYSWAVALADWQQGSSARIEAAPAPASPTAEELAQAIAYEAEQVAYEDEHDDY
eukprot:COSAG06_NODE_158_length_21760_cov_36.036979_11_plen_327_part_00